MLRLLGDGRLTDKPPADVRPTDAFLPIPDMQRINGKSWYWAYGTGDAGDAVCRTLSIADGDEHVDVRERPDRPLSTWPCYAGVKKVDAILLVPDEQRINGRSRFWLFHSVEGRQVYRKISIADGAESGLPPEQTAAIDLPDRMLSAWVSFNGIEKVDAFLPVPDLQRVDGKSWYWVFHTLMDRQVYRLISVADGRMHRDNLERGDRGLDLWRSLAGIARVDEFLAVPDMQRINGISLFWAFHQDKYRIIMTRDGHGHEDQVTVEDRPLTMWRSLTG